MTNLNLPTPHPTDDIWGAQYNANLVAMNTQLEGVSAAVDSVTGQVGQKADAASLTALEGQMAAKANKAHLPLAVKDYGATGNGSTDDRVAIQAALDAAKANGGGVVFLPPGTYLVGGTLILYDNVQLVGSGREVSTIRLANGANADVLRTENFAALTGSDPATPPYGPRLFAVASLTVDGNQANNTSGWGIRIYGYDYDLRDITVRECESGGIYSESSFASVIPDPDSMEARLSDVKVHNNGGRGVSWFGPHDSQWANVIAYLNADTGFHIGSGGDGVHARACHSWGDSQPYAWVIEDATFCELNSCVGEGAATRQVMILGNWNSVIGGFYYSAGGSLVGVQIGDATHPSVYGTTMSAVTCFGFENGSLDLTYEFGGSDLHVIHKAAGTVAWIGAPAAWSRVRVVWPGWGDFHLAGPSAQSITSVRRTAGHTGALQSWENESGTHLARINADGSLEATNFGSGAWTAYTPTLTASTSNPTMGTGAQVFGFWTQSGKTVTVRGRIFFGTGAAAGSGQYTVALPVARKVDSMGGGTGFVVDSSTGDYRLITLLDDTNASKVRLLATGNPSGAVVSDSSPWAWASGDEIKFTLTYEAA